METWVAYVIAAVVLAAVEVTTLTLWIGPFALGALAGAIVEAAGVSLPVSLSVAIVVSLLAVLAARPIARRHRTMPPALRTGTDALVGAEATVLQAIGDEPGTVKLEGEVWTARAYDGEPIAAGTRVHVMQIRGATALVSEL